MKKSLIALALVSAFAANAFAEEAAPAAPAGPHTFTANVSLASDYRFRGISQTYGLPAIQGGIDYSHSSGFYAGTWASNVYGGTNLSGLGVNYFNGGMEWDFYAGYKLTPAEDVTVDLGGLYYYYPGAKYLTVATDSSKYNNFELYGAVTWKWLTAKYSHALTNYFGAKGSTIGWDSQGGAANCGLSSSGTPTSRCTTSNSDSKGSGYIDLTAAYPLTEKLTLNAHIGHANVRHYGLLNYTDWKLGVSYDLNGWVLGANYIGTNAHEDVYRTFKLNSLTSVKSYDTSKDTVVVSVSRTF